jgi:hypothetical protein
MIKFIKNLLGRKKRIQELEEQLLECNGKLLEKQEHINATNAYYKKLIRQMKTKSKS